MSEEQRQLPLRYELRTVADFLSLPPGKVRACLLDFEVWLDIVRRGREAEREGSLRMTSPTDVFGWTDDGLHIATVQLRSASGELLHEEAVEFAPPEPGR